MGLVAQVGRIDPIGELCHPGHQLRGDFYVVSLDFIQCSNPEPGLDCEESEFSLPERSDNTGDESALS